MGAGNFSVHIGSFDLGGIGTATLAAILLNLVLNRREKQPDEIKLESSDAAKSLSQSS